MGTLDATHAETPTSPVGVPLVGTLDATRTETLASPVGVPLVGTLDATHAETPTSPVGVPLVGTLDATRTETLASPVGATGRSPWAGAAHALPPLPNVPIGNELSGICLGKFLMIQQNRAGGREPIKSRRAEGGVLPRRGNPSWLPWGGRGAAHTGQPSTYASLKKWKGKTLDSYYISAKLFPVRTNMHSQRRNQ